MWRQGQIRIFYIHLERNVILRSGQESEHDKISFFLPFPPIRLSESREISRAFQNPVLSNVIFTLRMNDFGRIDTMDKYPNL